MKIQDINNRIAIFITDKIGTMWCAYAFMGLALISLPEAIRGGTATLIAWIAQTFLQLVLLPMLMVGQSIQGQKTEERAQEHHEAILAEFAEIKSMHQEISLYITAK